jgi:hypothetical protein
MGTSEGGKSSPKGRFLRSEESFQKGKPSLPPPRYARLKKKLWTFCFYLRKCFLFIIITVKGRRGEIQSGSVDNLAAANEFVSFTENGVLFYFGLHLLLLLVLSANPPSMTVVCSVMQ